MRHIHTKYTVIQAVIAGVLSLFLMTACGQSNSVTVAPDKPSSPLLVTLQPLEAVVPGKVATFQAQVTTQASFSDVVLEVELPSPVRLVAGPLRWQGALVPGEPHSITFTVYLPTEGSHRILATATLQGGKGSIANEAVYVVGSEPGEMNGGVQITPRPAPPTSDGHPVMEYPLK